jgi:hypothetical protein
LIHLILHHENGEKSAIKVLNFYQLIQKLVNRLSTSYLLLLAKNLFQGIKSEIPGSQELFVPQAK